MRGQVGAAGSTDEEVQLEQPLLVNTEGTQRVRPQGIVRCLNVVTLVCPISGLLVELIAPVAHDAPPSRAALTSTTGASTRRSRRRPSLIRVLIVPSGSPS